jgi:hypothetical protein
MEIGTSVDVAVGGGTVIVDMAVGEAAGWSVTAGSESCVPQADSNRERVKNR